jgi:hypothetical protein
MRKTLTDRLLRSLKPETAHYDVIDTIIPSMGARVLKSGKISFTLHGQFPAAVLSLAGRSVGMAN